MTAGIKRLTARDRGEPSVAAGIAAGLLAFAVSKGASRARLAAEAGIALPELDHPDGRVPLERYRALMRAGAQCCDEPALALKFGESVDLAELSFIGLLFYAAE